MARHSDAKQRILDSAKELIYESSYANIGVQQICNQAEVKKGSFYHFFPSKQALTLEVLEHFWQGIQQTAQQTLLLTDRLPLQRLDLFLRRIGEWHLQHYQQRGHFAGCPMGNLASELSTLDDDMRQAIEAYLAKLQAMFAKVLHEAIAQGELAPEIDADYSAEAMVVYLEGLSLMSKLHNDPHWLSRLSPAIWQLIQVKPA